MCVHGRGVCTCTYVCTSCFHQVTALPQIITKALQKQSHVAVGKKPEKEGEEGGGGGEGGMPEPTHIRFSDSEHES